MLLGAVLFGTVLFSTVLFSSIPIAQCKYAVLAQIAICRKIRTFCAIFSLQFASVLFFTLFPSLQYGLQDEEGSEEGDPEKLAKSSLCLIGICKTGDVCAPHKVLDI